MSKLTIKTEVIITSDNNKVIEKLRRKLGAKKTAALFADKMRLSVRENWTDDSDCEVKTSVRVLKVG